jgi:hypothetical protein
LRFADTGGGLAKQADMTTDLIIDPIANSLNLVGPIIIENVKNKKNASSITVASPVVADEKEPSLAGN